MKRFARQGNAPEDVLRNMSPTGDIPTARLDERPPAKKVLVKGGFDAGLPGY